MSQKKIEQFLQSLRGSRQASEHTVTTYKNGLTLAEQFALVINKNIERWQTVEVQQFAAFCHKKKLSPRSIALHLSALRAFYRYSIAQGWLGDNPAIGVRAPKAAKRLPKIIDVDEAQGLLDTMPVDDLLAARDHAIMELFYSSGLRLSELQALTLYDWHSAEECLRVTGKGDKSRDVPVGRKAREAIAKWLARRDEIPSQSDALFLSRNGDALSARQIRQRVTLWGKNQGLSARLHPHKLRHACATHFLEGSGDLRAVQELLGHADLSTTQVYTHLDFTQLAKIYDAAHPRAKKK